MQSIPVPVTLTVELRPGGADIGSLERAVSAALAEVGRRLWQALLAALEASLAVPHGHVGCGGLLKANGRARRRIVSLAGEVALSRRRYRCGACRAEVVPLDEALGLEARSQHTLGVRERALWLVTELSYARTARTLDELRGLAVSHGQLHRWVAEEGARVEAHLAARREAVFGAHPERGDGGGPKGSVWVQADGTMVHDRGSSSEMEVKVGLVFDGVRRVGRERRELLGRRYHADIGSWTAFAERFTALCADLGVYEAERILFVSDGASAIRWIRERAFPTAIELLDWYHLVDALRRAIGDERPDRLEAALAVAAPGDALGLAELLAGWACEEAGSDLARSERLTAVRGYVLHNQRAIENYALVPLASSGPMEKAVDIVIARRFKARGMSWFRRGVSALVRLRLLRLNGEWSRYWAGRFGAALRPWPSAA